MPSVISKWVINISALFFLNMGKTKQKCTKWTKQFWWFEENTDFWVIISSNRCRNFCWRTRAFRSYLHQATVKKILKLLQILQWRPTKYHFRYHWQVRPLTQNTLACNRSWPSLCLSCSLMNRSMSNNGC